LGKLEGQVAIVIGASSGMGYATAQAMADEGAKLVVAARRQEQIDELTATIRAKGGDVIGQVADVGKRADVGTVVQAALKAHGRVDVLVNAAGVNTPDRRIATMRQEEWDRLININLTGAFHCTQAVLPQMREQKNGLIIHITSISGKWGDLSGAAYQASKHGMVGLAYATMFEERLNGIRVTLIFPGLCDTPILKNRPRPLPQETRDKMMKPEDIAAACVFVASLPPRTFVPELVMMPPALQTIGQAAL
jgi:serine 3-dehydrogenase (NADP+)